jgi:tetratricopeptide (TPR) repeat protein
MLAILAGAHLRAHHYEEAIAWARKSIQQRPDNPEPYVTLASALGHLGRIYEAQAALQGCERARRGYIEQRPSGDDHLLEGLRKCGWPA